MLVHFLSKIESFRRSRLTSGGDGNLDSPAHVDPKEALDKLLGVLTFFHSTLVKHGLDPEIISQIFKQVRLRWCRPFRDPL